VVIWLFESCKYGYLRWLVDLHFTLILQAVGIIAAVGDSVTDLKIGTPAAVMTFGSYAEFMMVNYLERHCFLCLVQFTFISVS
jgi:NADPH:quinone reductase-like Zn-dependent oxidoreductase